MSAATGGTTNIYTALAIAVQLCTSAVDCLLSRYSYYMHTPSLTVSIFQKATVNQASWSEPIPMIELHVHVVDAVRMYNNVSCYSIYTTTKQNHTTFKSLLQRVFYVAKEFCSATTANQKTSTIRLT